ncbi:hemolysin activation/secretion protein [Haloferula luteola]|uniref:Hemolysin activation/secretion protein n=1 Tax=Haloferula luteola TaxID=595692 RepID=A0A840V7V7_9BACT|nr:ShlB/FhaC/HecB family hemolysin secretion/activation protein [Haloferula luteola]MBB5350040.1 hemolysin activation/secretion protein [Haloferula luteola]
MRGWTPVRVKGWILLMGLGVVRAESLPGIQPNLPDQAEVESLPSVEAQTGQDEVPNQTWADALKVIRLRSAEGGDWFALAEGIEASGELVLPSPATLAARLKPFLGHPVTDVSLGQMADEILLHYDAEGFPVVLVSAPEQDFSEGGLVIDVEVGKVGKVGVTPPKHGNPELIRQGLRLRTGEWLQRKKLEEQLTWYGRTGFRHPRLFVSPGEGLASADLLIALEERRPWQVSVGYENSGPDVLGQDRMVFGVSGLLPNEHLLAWRGVMGMPASSLTANAIRWEIPLHRSHQVIQVDAAYAEVASRYLFRGIPLETEGSSWTLAVLDRMILPKAGAWEQSLWAGFELKGTDQFLLFGGASVTPGEVVMADWKVSHRIEREWKSAGVKFSSDLRYSPGGLGDRNRDAAFRAYDLQADATYLIANFDANAWWRTEKDWRWVGRWSLQAADSHLLPAEQLGAGGYQTVRGVDERAYSMDNGAVGGLEVQTPVISVIPRCDFRLLAFFDHAALQDDDGGSVSLSSVGLGLRARLWGHVDLRFDHGWRLDDTEHRNHLGVSMSF